MDFTTFMSLDGVSVEFRYTVTKLQTNNIQLNCMDFCNCISKAQHRIFNLNMVQLSVFFRMTFQAKARKYVENIELRKRSLREKEKFIRNV